ncbi:MAG: hypothetical protein K8T10_18315 [Candidatus Eremiobacteraeota bacterium]|nr:hypothetical protein [Candidatus Eremiobacteraeota bacterium]
MNQKENDRLFGEKAPEIFKFIDSLSSFSWFANVGKHNKMDSNVIRVWHLEDAWASHPLGNNSNLNALREINSIFSKLESKGVLDQSDRERGLNIPYDKVKSLPFCSKPSILKGKAAIWAGLTTLEILVSIKPESPFFFRKMIPWYRDGHWPCAIRDNDNRMIVY